jgi:tripartite motif-containing protein 71
VAVGGSRVYVADFGNDRVQVFGSDGSVLSSLGARGSGDGQFQRPAGVAVGSDGTVFVTDHFNDRVERFGGDGRYQAQFGTPALSASATGTPTAISTATASSASSSPSPTATLTLTPAAGVSVTPVLASVTATPVPAVALADTQLRRPEGITLDASGNLWVADYGRDRVVKLSPDGHLLQVLGSRGTNAGEFVGPKGVAVEPSTGRIYVADTGNSRIQRFLPDGTADALWPMPQ